MNNFLYIRKKKTGKKIVLNTFTSYAYGFFNCANSQAVFIRGGCLIDNALFTRTYQEIAIAVAN